MDIENKLFESLKNYAGDDYEESQNDFLLTLIYDATEEVLLRVYPNGFSTAEKKEEAQNLVMLNYESKIRRIAEYHYDKQGKEGVTSFSENGSSASYENSGTPESYFRGIIPISVIL